MVVIDMTRLLLAVAVCVSTCGFANAQYARCNPVRTQCVQPVYCYTPSTWCPTTVFARTCSGRYLVPQSSYASPVVRYRWYRTTTSPVPVVVIDPGSVNAGSTVMVPAVPNKQSTGPTDSAPVPAESAPAQKASVDTAPAAPKTPAAESAEPATDANADIRLFDGKSLQGWKKTEFGGEGDVEVDDGVLILGEGADMTGVHTDRKLPRVNYEVELDAQRIEGSDFFVGFTFPVKDKYCSLILGGWGGGVCGLSSIDGYDASENPTTSYQEFRKGQWYHVRLRVTADKIEAWLDKQKLVDQTITKRELSIRFEVEPSRPFGFATYQTIAGLKNIKLRKVDKPDSPPEDE